MTKIGITTTVPAEFIYAAGHTPVDLNNIFITGSHREEAIAAAEMAGYPRTVCGWLKGIYGLVVKMEAVKEVIAVTQGDCSQTHALMETLEDEGIRVIPFSYPFSSSGARRKASLQMEMEHFAGEMGCSWQQALNEKKRLDKSRRLIWEIDDLTWKENKVKGFENHLWQVSCSDFEGDRRLLPPGRRNLFKRPKKESPIKISSAWP